MADFNGTAHTPPSSQAAPAAHPVLVHTWPAVAVANADDRSSLTHVGGSLLQAAAGGTDVAPHAAASFVPGQYFSSGAQVTFVMRARVVATATYVKWISVNEPDPLMTLAFNQTGQLPSNLTDVAVHSKVVR